MGLDISTQYTRELGKKCGRNGYVMAKREKETIIPVSDYGMFLMNNRKRRKR